MRQIAADAVIIRNSELLLVKRNTEPFKGMWALPGGRLGEDETVEECCIREAKEEAGVDVEILKMTGIYSDPGRDPRKIVAVAYLCKLEGGKEKAGKGEISEVRWCPLENLPQLASDHAQMVRDALRMK